MHRTLRGPLADWGVPEFILRRIEHQLAGANWQRSGGKSTHPKPIELPDGKGRGSSPAQMSAGAEAARRLRNLGMLPPGSLD